MSKSLKPLYSLTIGEYIELNKRTFAEEVGKLLNNQQTNSKEENKSDIIFIDEAADLTGYKKATLYSKVCRFEIPVLSRRKPLTFSRQAIIDWISNGKPSLIDEETDKYLKSKR
ncbi:MerR family transcriptional regulator [Flavivirga eckloniae]|uniref:Uncharacterized protein n=1 Tax=Flavivirga eckloniae TaxID=1803846 RepID=A0A2K9PVZ0_9FLAO|nr:helix-turn-helix domain-containing protein [Flavivirga eckloniae]AUP81220.1 hypothetical protein C1H87_21885 [Flavivirga eckloniae]